MIAGNIMGITTYHENMKRGSNDFSASYYYVDRRHPRYQMISHWHNEFEIIRVLSGKLSLKLNGTIIDMEEGDGIFFSASMMHSAVAKDCVYECVVFEKSIFGASAKCRNFADNFGYRRYKDSDDMKNFFEAFSKKYEGYEFIVISLIYKMSFDMLDGEKAEKLAEDKAVNKIRPAIAIIEEDFGSRITLESLSKACGVSQNYFSRCFKEITGQTPFEYLLTYRIETACKMLLNGNDSVTDVCFKCGFNDLSYFINVFKKHMGMSPKSYIKNYNV